MQDDARRLLDGLAAAEIAEYLFVRASHRTGGVAGGDHSLELVFRDGHLRRVYLKLQPGLAEFGHAVGGL